MRGPGWFLPVDSAAYGLALDRHLVLNLWIALALLVLLHLLLLTGLVLSRRPQTAATERRRFNPVETLPVLALAALFAFLTIRAERLWAAARYTGPDPSALQVEATGMQFAWYFRYPGADAAFGFTSPRLIDAGAGNPLGIDPADPRGADDLVTSELVLPAGRPIDLHIRAQDVMHGFAVPQLRLQQAAIPGQTEHIHFTATRPGTYAILCTQLCGLGHFRMQASLRVLPAADYAAWLAAKEKAVSQ